MFSLKFLVEDKHLSKVMHALDGLALNLTVVPVTNAAPVKEKGKKVVRETGQDPSSLKGLLAQWLLDENRGLRVTNKEMVAKYQALGGDGNSVNTGMIKSFLDDGILTRIARGQYQVAK